MKILAVCPTIYIEKYDNMIKTFELTVSKNTEICLCPYFTVTDAINDAFRRNPDFDFYHITNDDVSYETPLWDVALANKCKISYADDGLQGKNLCAFPMIDGNIARALGWLVMPYFKKYCGDVVWKFMGESLKILEYHPEVSITHNWDETQVDKDIHKSDMMEFAKWLPWAYKDLAKIRRIL